MKQNKINKAYPSITKLKEYNLPVKKAYAIYKLCAAITECYDFAANEQRKYLEEYNGDVAPDGNIKFPTPADCEAFVEKINELDEMEVDKEFEEVTLTEADLMEQTLTADDIENLEGFVEFEI